MQLWCAVLPFVFLVDCELVLDCYPQVAAKLLKRSDEIALGDFRTEIAILRKTHHPNTTQVSAGLTSRITGQGVYVL
jgi:hypothetical protein